VAIRAGEVILARGSAITASSIKAGNAGQVTVTADAVELRDASVISSSTFGSGDAGRTTVTTGHLLAAADPSSWGSLTGIISNAFPGSTGNAGQVIVKADELELHSTGKISSFTSGPGNAGDLLVTAGRLLVVGNADSSGFITGIASIAAFGVTGAAGRVTVRADTIELRDTGVIDSSTFGPSHGGKVMVTADRLLVIGQARSPSATGIASDTASSGNAGRVTVRTGTIELRGTGSIASSTFGTGDGGEVVVSANRLLAIGDGASSFASGVFSTAEEGSTGDAGRVMVTADELELRDTGKLSSGTFGPGNGGTIIVKAGRLLAVGDVRSRSSTGITSDAFPSSSGAAGRVNVTADAIELRDTGSIASSTFGTGDGGEVTVRTSRLLAIGHDNPSGFITGVFSQAEPGSTGAAGRVIVTADAVELRDTGVISTSTFGPGDAGAIAVAAGGLLISGNPSSRFGTGIASQANPGSIGAAGRVTVTADSIEVRRTGQISSSTSGPGAAGEVSVTAGRLTVTDKGLVQTNSEQASGAAGNVSVQVGHLTVSDDGLIGSSGTGPGPAGNVHLDTDTLKVTDASIRTEGAGAVGGRIDAVAEDLISLKDAEVTSSGIVPGAGQSVITLTAPLIALNDSQVTSLTGSGEPLAGSGLAQLFGDVTVISLDSFVAASSSVTVTGAEGDVGSRLVVPQGVFLDAGDLLRESCAARRSGTASSFTAMGQGGLPPDPAGPLAGSYRESGGATATGQTGPVLAASTFDEGCKTAPGG
jgi:hypothetical protein